MNSNIHIWNQISTQIFKYDLLIWNSNKQIELKRMFFHDKKMSRWKYEWNIETDTSREESDKKLSPSEVGGKGNVYVVAVSKELDREMNQNPRYPIRNATIVIPRRDFLGAFPRYSRLDIVESILNTREKITRLPSTRKLHASRGVLSLSLFHSNYRFVNCRLINEH